MLFSDDKEQRSFEIDVEVEANDSQTKQKDLPQIVQEE